MDNAIKQVSSVVCLEAAYGRSYATAEVAIRAWKEGKDFKIVDGPYTSIRDLGILMWDYPDGIYLSYESGIVKI
jgi:hypothetical protein